MKNIIPIIDIFAGPGGLGEGFSAIKTEVGMPAFKIKLSIEKDNNAHETLELRAFFRQFSATNVPTEYYQYLRKEIDKEELVCKYPEEYDTAKKEAWQKELGKKNRGLVKTRIEEALAGVSDWVLIGGPPCQAYSLVGRSRMRGSNKRKYREDRRHYLYKEYLQILADHQPPVFVMENVKGLLSSRRIRKESTFDLIISDLKHPLKVNRTDTEEPLSYKLFSLSKKQADGSDEFEPKDFIIRSEEYGIPQARHRVIIFGVRADLKKSAPDLLKEVKKKISINNVIDDLPRLRSGLSKERDSEELWRDAVKAIAKENWVDSLPSKLKKAIIQEAEGIEEGLSRGNLFIKLGRNRKKPVGFKHYLDPSLAGVCNHETRSHIRKDLHRYFFAAVYAKINGRSPTLNDFPKELLPNHENIQDDISKTIFNDRFRVQVHGKPSTTVVSHISKDGHYYIHYDPSQCRSLTVREAARLQTFPDNYFFEGNRTQQYHQVGNAVPPLLAKKIAEIVYDVLNKPEQRIMPDVFTKGKRSEVMSRIKGKNNKDTELAMIQIMRKHHVSGWRRNKNILGKPDFVFPKQKVALFVDGCFWHMCPDHFRMPKNNRSFWEKKLTGNKDRDKYITKSLRQLQWKVIRVWEHELSNSDRVAKRILKVLQTSKN